MEMNGPGARRTFDTFDYVAKKIQVSIPANVEKIMDKAVSNR